MASSSPPFRPLQLPNNNNNNNNFFVKGNNSSSTVIRATSNGNGMVPTSITTSGGGGGGGGGGRGGGGPLVLEIPLEKIRRPLMRTRSNDPDKVQELMDSIQQIGLQVPIDVLEVEGVYYGFSGCHRYEAHQRLGLPTIRCKIRRGTKETLRHHLR